MLWQKLQKKDIENIADFAKHAMIEICEFLHQNRKTAETSDPAIQQISLDELNKMKEAQIKDLSAKIKNLETIVKWTWLIA